MLKEQIIEDIKAARIARDSATLTFLSTLYGEMQTKEKQGVVMVDAEVVKILKKFMDGVTETQNLTGVTDQSARELAILGKYMPAQLTVAEIASILQGVGIKDRGPAQQYMRTHYAGRYNGADVNKALT